MRQGTGLEGVAGWSGAYYADSPARTLTHIRSLLQVHAQFGAKKTNEINNRVCVLNFLPVQVRKSNLHQRKNGFKGQWVFALFVDQKHHQLLSPAVYFTA